MKISVGDLFFSTAVTSYCVCLSIEKETATFVLCDISGTKIEGRVFSMEENQFEKSAWKKMTEMKHELDLSNELTS